MLHVTKQREYMNYEKIALQTLGIFFALIFILGRTRMIVDHRERMKELENEAKMTMQMQYPLADEKPWYKIF